MKQLSFEVAAARYTYALPENWAEITPLQLRHYVADGGFSNRMIERLLDLSPVVAACLAPADWWWLRRELDYLRDPTGISTQLLPELKVDGIGTLYGYNADFTDVSWVEWCYADTYAARGRWDVVTATLYRPQRTDYNGETDRRVPFSKYGTENRLAAIARLDDLTLQTIRLLYLALRHRLTDHYPHLFPPRDTDTKAAPSASAPTDWLTIIRNAMGDHFHEEAKYMALPVPSVLFQLERRIKENQHSAK